MKVQIDGMPVHAQLLASRALVNFGHFTSMQVRNGSVKGLGHHLARLDSATQELFGQHLAHDMLAGQIRDAVGNQADACTVRVDVFSAHDHAQVSVMVSVSDPQRPAPGPISLKAVCYQRPIAHIKHVGSFPQLYYRRLARTEGFDDALLTNDRELVSETATANIGFLLGDRVIWPEAPSLRGITLQLLEEEFLNVGFSSETRHVSTRDLASFDLAFTINSIGISPVGRVGGTTIPVSTPLLQRIQQAYDGSPWQPL